MILFCKGYDGESLCDLERDISEGLQGDYNALIHSIPVDEDGIMKGYFKVIIEWEE